MNSDEKSLSHKKICVLMSTYNGQQYVEEQITSIINQEINCELCIMIRDDGSNDKTCEIIKQLQNKYPNKIMLKIGKNIGCDASFFELLNNAFGYDYYALSDQDDIWLPNKLNEAIQVLEKENNSQPLLYASTSYLVDENLNILDTTRKQTKQFTIFNTIVQNICAGHTQVMNQSLLDVITKDKLDMSKIHFYDAYIMNLAILYGKVVFDNNSHVYYRQHNLNFMGYGQGFIGRLITCFKHIVSGKGKLYRIQAKYFISKNKKSLLNKGYYEDLNVYYNSVRLREKLKYILKKHKVYRQNFFETILMYMAFLLNLF